MNHSYLAQFVHLRVDDLLSVLRQVLHLQTQVVVETQLYERLLETFALPLLPHRQRLLFRHLLPRFVAAGKDLGEVDGSGLEVVVEGHFLVAVEDALVEAHQCFAFVFLQRFVLLELFCVLLQVLLQLSPIFALFIHSQPHL